MSHPFPEASSVGSGRSRQGEGPGPAGEEAKLTGGPVLGAMCAAWAAECRSLCPGSHLSANLAPGAEMQVKWPLMLRALEVTPTSFSRKET